MDEDPGRAGRGERLFLRGLLYFIGGYAAILLALLLVQGSASRGEVAYGSVLIIAIAAAGLACSSRG